MDKQTLIKKLKVMTASPNCRDVVKLDEMPDTAHSNETVQYFGVEGAKKFAATADALKASGAEYCNCLACSIAREVLDHKQLLRS